METLPSVDTLEENGSSLQHQLDEGPKCPACGGPEGDSLIGDWLSHGKVPTASIFEREALGDCPKCTVLSRLIEQYFPGVAPNSTHSVFWGFSNCANTVKLGFTQLSELHRVLYVELAVQREYDSELITYDSDSAFDKEGSRFGATTIDIVDPSSDDALQWSEAKLKQCVTTHALCSREYSSNIPTRLIDVENLDAIKLVSGKAVQSDISYIALSHCWGHIKPKCQTTRLTLEARMNHIPIHLLPKTFLDAATYCKRLGFRYLWIDSVCIIQDDENDWRREAARMHMVYGNALLTIAAAESSNCEGGLFHSCTHKHQILHLGAFEIDGHQLAIKAREMYPTFHDDHNGLFREYPLRGRAWAFQERLLSRRMLSFTNCEIHWQCCEYEDSLASGKISPSDLGFRSSKVAHLRSLMDGKHTQRWRRMVTEFSDLDLCRKSDRLPAISALAQQQQLYRPGDTYLAGLWASTLHEDLLWVGCSERHTGHKDFRALEYIAPTWSWASVFNCPLYFCEPSADSDAPSTIKRPKIVNASCEYKQGIPYGEVLSGVLEISGKVAAVAFRNVGHFEYHITLDNEACIRFDAAGLHLDQRRICEPTYMLNMYESEERIICLILKKQAGADLYERTGLLNLKNDDYTYVYGNVRGEELREGMQVLSKYFAACETTLVKIV